MDTKLKELLINGIIQIDPQLNNDKVVCRLEKLFDEITLFNPVYKLVAANGEDLVVKHILDCLAPYSIIKKDVESHSVFADLGSGSGLPGLVLASVFENKFFLVERMGRRAGFLRNTIALLGMNDRVIVIEKDLSEVDEQFNYITFRAFRQMKDIVQDLKRITAQKAIIFAYKSQEENILEDVKYLNPDIFAYSVNNYKVPFLNADRSLLTIVKKS